jgi:hypothetical protein
MRSENAVLIAAELGWLSKVVADLRSGALTCDYDTLSQLAEFEPDAGPS